MLRTMWFALTCLAGLGMMIAIKVAMTTDLATRDQAAAAIVSNVAAKSDRLPLSDFRWAPQIHLGPSGEPAPPVPAASPPAASPDPSSSQEAAEAIDKPPRKPVTTASAKTAHRRWQDSNARLEPDAPPRHRATAEPQKTTAESSRDTAPSHVFKCRQDNFGILLRALELSPHCSS